jgi:hypothetical protein
LSVAALLTSFSNWSKSPCCCRSTRNLVVDEVDGNPFAAKKNEVAGLSGTPRLSDGALVSELLDVYEMVVNVAPTERLNGTPKELPPIADEFRHPRQRRCG